MYSCLTWLAAELVIPTRAQAKRADGKAASHGRQQTIERRWLNDPKMQGAPQNVLAREAFSDPTTQPTQSQLTSAIETRNVEPFSIGQRLGEVDPSASP
jgi:hypothetical protein